MQYNTKHLPTVVTLWRGGEETTIINPHLRMMLRHTGTIRKVR